MKKIFLICLLTLIASQFVFAIPHFSVENKDKTNLVTVRRSVENKKATNLCTYDYSTIQKDKEITNLAIMGRGGRSVEDKKPTNLAIWGGDWRSVEDKKPTNLGAVYNRFSVENKETINLGGAIYNPGGYSVENKDATELVTVRRSVDNKDATDLAVFPLIAPLFSSENKDAKELNEETENRVKQVLLTTSAPEVKSSFWDKCKELVIIVIP